ncbi:MAG: alanine racemase [Solirubrobacteraceae bacterium]|nr:alanine racemase [Solirubrobacteraceae bacterium]
MADVPQPTSLTQDAERACVRIDAAAIAANVATMASAAPSSQCCAVVKADGYGHGALTAARAALAGGATWLAVATAAEATELRAAGIEARLLILGPLTLPELEAALVADADIVAWTDALLDAAAALGGARIHVKLDTGMGRLGTRDPEEALALLRRCVTTPGLDAVGAMTHFATADELGDRFFPEQLARFAAWIDRAREVVPEVIAHAANSAAILRDADSHFDLVRPGVSIYGLDPFGADPVGRELTPALALSATVGAVRPIAKGESAGYGRRWVAPADGYIGVIPVGYADGWRRGLTNAADALIEGQRRPLVGTVSMDSVAVDLGTHPVAVGTEAVLIGTQGEERILVEDLARTLGTINYEITCGLGPRLPRR